MTFLAFECLYCFLFVTFPRHRSPAEPPRALLEEPELQARVRAHRLVQLGKRLAEMRPDDFSYT